MEVRVVRNDELYHYGVLGMKWGVRRYQNKDGRLTDAGKKRLSGSITSRKTSVIDAKKIASEAIRSDKELARWRESDSYKRTVRAKSEYMKSKQKYLDEQDKVWHDVLKDVEKKHGRYEDLMLDGDKTKISKFNKDYDSLLDKRFKEKGIYDLEKDKNTKYETFREAGKTLEKDTRNFIEGYLGEYGNKTLKGQGSAIYRGHEIVNRISTTDIFTQSYVDMANRLWES